MGLCCSTCTSFLFGCWGAVLLGVGSQVKVDGFVHHKRSVAFVLFPYLVQLFHLLCGQAEAVVLFGHSRSVLHRMAMYNVRYWGQKKGRGSIPAIAHVTNNVGCDSTANSLGGAGWHKALRVLSPEPTGARPFDLSN